MKLSADQIDFFHHNGYLAAEKVVSDAGLAPVIAAYEGWISRRAEELRSEGAIEQLHADASFERRLALLAAQSTRITDGLDIMQARLPAMCAFLSSTELLDSVECLVGPEITCNPIQHIRAKPPSRVETSGYYNVPWHQDAGVTWEEADDSNIVTCWIAMVDATIENGCMEVMPGAFRSGYMPHHSGEGGTTVRPDVLPDIPGVAVPVRKGGAVFMHRYTPHRSTANSTDIVRWSIDLRYQPTGQPTGRPFYPDFVVRSGGRTIDLDHAEWAQRWEEALETSKGARFHRV